jgi:hypothetical protein
VLSGDRARVFRLYLSKTLTPGYQRVTEVFRQELNFGMMEQVA